MNVLPFAARRRGRFARAPLSHCGAQIAVGGCPTTSDDSARSSSRGVLPPQLTGAAISSSGGVDGHASRAGRDVARANQRESVKAANPEAGIEPRPLTQSRMCRSWGRELFEDRAPVGGAWAPAADDEAPVGRALFALFYVAVWIGTYAIARYSAGMAFGFAAAFVLVPGGYTLAHPRIERFAHLLARRA